MFNEKFCFYFLIQGYQYEQELIMHATVVIFTGICIATKLVFAVVFDKSLQVFFF